MFSIYSSSQVCCLKILISMELILSSRSLMNILNNADSSSCLLSTPINTASQSLAATFAISLYLLTISHFFLQPYLIMALQEYVSSVFKRILLDLAAANGKVTSWLHTPLSLSSVSDRRMVYRAGRQI